MSERINQIIKNMIFFQNLANLKEFNYPIDSIKNLKEYSEKFVLFPKMGYFDTCFIKLRYKLKYKKGVD